MIGFLLVCFFVVAYYALGAVAIWSVDSCYRSWQYPDSNFGLFDWVHGWSLWPLAVLLQLHENWVTNGEGEYVRGSFYYRKF